MFGQSKEDLIPEEGNQEDDLFAKAAEEEEHEAKSDYQESFANSEIDGVQEEAKSTDDGPLYYETSESATPEKVLSLKSETSEPISPSKADLDEIDVKVGEVEVGDVDVEVGADTTPKKKNKKKKGKR